MAGSGTGILVTTTPSSLTTGLYGIIHRIYALMGVTAAGNTAGAMSQTNLATQINYSWRRTRAALRGKFPSLLVRSAKITLTKDEGYNLLSGMDQIVSILDQYSVAIPQITYGASYHELTKIGYERIGNRLFLRNYETGEYTLRFQASLGDLFSGVCVEPQAASIIELASAGSAEWGTPNLNYNHYIGLTAVVSAGTGVGQEANILASSPSDEGVNLTLERDIVATDATSTCCVMPSWPRELDEYLAYDVVANSPLEALAMRVRSAPGYTDLRQAVMEWAWRIESGGNEFSRAFDTQPGDAQIC